MQCPAQSEANNFYPPPLSLELCPQMIYSPHPPPLTILLHLTIHTIHHTIVYCNTVHHTIVYCNTVQVSLPTYVVLIP